METSPAGLSRESRLMFQHQLHFLTLHVEPLVTLGIHGLLHLALRGGTLASVHPDCHRLGEQDAWELVAHTGPQRGRSLVGAAPSPRA